MTWTVYCHTHVETGRRYVGLTSRTWQRRWAQHVSQSFRSNFGRSHFQNAIRLYGKDAFSHEILGIHDTLEAANAAEHEWIEKLGTTDPEKGFNFLKGGSQKPPSPERNPWDRPEYRARQKARLERQWEDPSFRASVLSSNKITRATPEFLEASSSRSKSLWENPDFRRRVTESSRPSPEAKARGIEAMKVAFSTPESVRKRSESAKKTWESGSLLARQRALREDSDYVARVHSGLSRGAFLNRSKTHCKRGHGFTPENTRVNRRGSRICKACQRLSPRS